MKLGLAFLVVAMCLIATCEADKGKSNLSFCVWTVAGGSRFPAGSDATKAFSSFALAVPVTWGMTYSEKNVIGYSHGHCVVQEPGKYTQCVSNLCFNNAALDFTKAPGNLLRDQNCLGLQGVLPSGYPGAKFSIPITGGTGKYSGATGVCIGEVGPKEITPSWRCYKCNVKF